MKKGPGSGASTPVSYTYLANNGKLDTLTYKMLRRSCYCDSLDKGSKIWYNTGEGKYLFDYISEHLFKLGGK